MANSATGNPWVLDTADCNTLLTSARVKIVGVRWVGATAAAHYAELQDTHCNTIWRAVSGGSSYVEADSVNSNRLYTGLKVASLGSGKLYVEFG